jgi:hypothetical protein
MFSDGLILPLILKAIGSFTGAVLALVFQPPKTIAEFVTRSVFSTLVGFLGGDAARENYLHWTDTWQMWLASAALTAMLSWFIMGAVTRIIAKLKWAPKE